MNPFSVLSNASNRALQRQTVRLVKPVVGKFAPSWKSRELIRLLKTPFSPPGVRMVMGEHADAPDVGAPLDKVSDSRPIRNVIVRVSQGGISWC